MRRLVFILLLTPSLSGCTMLEYLAPHNLWKLNRQPSMTGDALFSIPAQPGSLDSTPASGLRKSQAF